METKIADQMVFLVVSFAYSNVTGTPRALGSRNVQVKSELIRQRQLRARHGLAVIRQDCLSWRQSPELDMLVLNSRFGKHHWRSSQRSLRPPVEYALL
jgi:hypothetical protein